MTDKQTALDIARPWLRLGFWLVLAAVAVFAARQLAPILAWVLRVVSPFLIALVVAYVFHPIVTFVQHRLHLGRAMGILVLALAILAVAGGVVLWLVPVLYQQASDGLRAMGEGASELVGKLANRLDPQTREQIAERWSAVLAQYQEQLKQAALSLGGALAPMAQGGAQAVAGVAGGVWSGLLATGSFVATAAFVLIITVYYLLDMYAIPQVIRRMLPEGRRERIWDLAVKADRAVGGFLRGQLTACLGVGLLGSLLLFAIGMRQYAILVGFFAGLMNFIPYLGPAAGATPAIAWVLASGRFPAWDERGLMVLVVIGGFALIQTIDGFVFQPYIVGRQASLHPLLVMFALAVGSSEGIVGMMMAVPTACIVKVLWVELYWSKRPKLDPPKKEASAP